MTPQINRMILEKAKIYPRYVEHGRSIADYQILRDIISRSQSAIKGAKSNFLFCFGEIFEWPSNTPNNTGQSYTDFSISAKYPKILPYATITRS